VATATVLPRDLARSVAVTGRVEPIRTVAVNAQTSGTVTQVLVEEGDRIRAGRLMAELDARETEAQLQRARAVFDNAKAAFDRAAQLRASQLYSAAELEVMESSLAIAEADVELWSTRLAFCRITAPISGMVTTKRVEQGNTVSANQAMFTIADDSLLVVKVQVSELDVVYLETGREVEIRLDAYPQARIEGRIRRIFPSADPGSRLVPVEVAMGAVPEGVEARPGFLARVDFALDLRRGVLAVPASAVGILDQRNFVYLVAADTLARREVETGLTAGGWIEITSGLQEGDRVVSSGHTNLRQGLRVRVSGDTPVETPTDG
jgi:RND family efflux transporter MFP subunit